MLHVETGAALNDLRGMYHSLKGIFEPDALLCCVDVTVVLCNSYSSGNHCFQKGC